MRGSEADGSKLLPRAGIVQRREYILASMGMEEGGRDWALEKSGLIEAQAKVGVDNLHTVTCIPCIEVSQSAMPTTTYCKSTSI